MNAPVLARRLAPTVSRTAMAKDVFGRYMPEKKERVREAEVKKDPVLKSLIEAWKVYNFDLRIVTPTNYARAIIGVRDLTITAKAIEEFSVALGEFQSELGFSKKASLFLSALINKSPDTDFVIHTTHLEEKLDLLGFENTKNVIVEGDVGSDLGISMIRGKIVIKGNVHDGAGVYMHGGKITIEGNAGSYVGTFMEGGEILVMGDATHEIGFRMCDGEIHLNGTYMLLANSGELYGGKIYYKGKLIYPKKLSDEQ